MFQMSDTTQNAGGDVEDVKTEGKETENGTEIGNSNGNGNGSGQEHRKDSGNGNGTEEHIPLSDAPRSEFVIVADASGEPMEIPTNEDNTMFMTTLQASFPGATGLKYKNPKTGASRAVVVDPRGTRLLPPQDGWEDKVFTAIIPTGRGAESSAKRRKAGSEGESDSDGEGTQRKRGATEADAVKQPVDLIVLGVNYKTTDEAFKEYFNTFGTVVFAEIKRTAEGTSKGFGFVRMSTLEEQDKVVQNTNHMLDGRRCDVKVPDPRGSFGSQRAPITKIFVGRLTDKVTEANLQDFFNEKAKAINSGATVTDVFVPKPFRGFAFVSFSHSECADKISKQGNYLIEGVSVAVSLAVPRDEVQHGRGGFMNDYSYGKGGGRDAGFGYGGPDKFSRYPSPNVFGSNAARDGWGGQPSRGNSGGPWRGPPMGRGDDGMKSHGGSGREARYGNSASGRRSPYEGGRMDRMERGRDRGRERDRDRDNHSANAPAFSTDMGRALSGPGPASSAIIPGLGSHAAASSMQSMQGTPYSHSRSAYAPSSPPLHNPYGPSTHSHVYSQQPYSPQPSSGPRSMQGAGSARPDSYQGTTGASTIANGLDALNLGNQNSEFLSVLSQFYHTLRGNYAAQEKWKS
ncbi:hypothetical protein WR25_03755 isoform A [Diploscapter pachys]|uniref:RRM domain-containing protein n=1 Tax=Diploscapter pachys TaxID=2018661 RepID=A0A2A2LNB8_9BILA|nr:hypothetical protein WR25_03755 isoform A [Diploscapter pachys]